VLGDPDVKKQYFKPNRAWYAATEVAEADKRALEWAPGAGKS
jgi:hypothetical protein